MTDALPPYFRQIDVHTHSTRQLGQGAIVCIEPDNDGETLLATAPADAMLSVGVHPWHAEDFTPATLEKMRNMACDAHVVAIGECGLDARRGPALDVQLPVFEAQARLADELGLPLIIHAVGTWAQIIDAKKRLHPRMPWIIHGFRGKPELARQLVSHGLYLSLGQRYNADVPAVVDPKFLLHETDSPSDNG